MRPWELHPMLVAFPVAFLVASAFVDWRAVRRDDANLARLGTWLLGAGVVTGLAAGAAGVLAFLTLPAAEMAGRAQPMAIWHAATAAGGILVAAASYRARRREPAQRVTARPLGAIAALLVVVAGHLGGSLVFRLGVGVEAEPYVLPPRTTVVPHPGPSSRTGSAVRGEVRLAEGARSSQPGAR